MWQKALGDVQKLEDAGNLPSDEKDDNNQNSNTEKPFYEHVEELGLGNNCK